MKIRHPVEALVVILAGTVLRILPLDFASATAGWTMRIIGPRLPSHRTAQRNLQIAFPDMSDVDRVALLTKMWDNIGRVAGELPHLGKLAADRERVQILDPDNLTQRLNSAGHGAIFASAHFGNWELAPIVGYRAGLVVFNVYRAPNNPIVDFLLRRLRLRVVRGGLIAKNPNGMKEAVAQLRRNNQIGMIFDQRSREGILAKFFGEDVKTTHAPALLARRFDIPILLRFVERLDGAYFRIHVVAVPERRTKNSAADVARTTEDMNATLERWIRKKPELWFWVHHRWPDKFYL